MDGFSINSSLDQPSERAVCIHTARAQVEAACRRRRELIAAGRLSGEQPPAKIPDGTFRGYTVQGEIHRGGQGVVYQARQASTNRHVAIKVLLDGAHASKSAQQRFEREIELVASLRHPNVISVFHSDVTADGLRYCVMDHVRGLPITRYVRQHELSLAETLLLFIQVCEAVNHAHQKGVIHRDLKPSNILVDAEGVPRVLDFGLAKILGETDRSSVSLTGQLVGTLPYMSPEQTRGNGDELDIRTDVYALGVLLYELITDHYPYPLHGSMSDVLKHIVETEPTPPVRYGLAQSLAAGRAGPSVAIDEDLQTIMLKSLAKERDRRYQSVGELARDIRHYLADEPIEARRDSISYIMRKQLRRHRVAVGAGVAFLALLIAGLATSLRFAYRADHAAADSEAQRKRAESFGTFLKEMLTLADPARARGENLTVREALERAAKRIDDGAMRDLPLVEAEIRNTIGSTYFALSLWRPQAEEQFRAAAAIQAQALGNEHPDTLRSQFYLARTLIRTDLDRAAALADPTMKSQRRVLGPDHVDTLRTMVLLGVIHAWSGRFHEGEALLVDAIQRREKSLGSDHVDTAYFLNRLGETYIDNTYPERAEPLHREALRIFAQAFGDEHPDTMRSLEDLGASLHNQHRDEEAEAIYRRLLEPTIRIIGPDSPATLGLKNELAGSLMHQGKHAEAEPIFRATLAAQLRTLGPTDYDTIMTQRWFASSLAAQKKYVDAEALLRDALTAALEKYGPQDVGTTMRLKCALAYVLAHQQKDEETEQVAREVLDSQRNIRPRPWPEEVQQVSLALMEILNRRGENDEAVKVERELIENWLSAARAPNASAHTIYMAAWRMLKPENESLRDPQGALQLALRLNERSGGKDPRHLGTLAKAYSLTGNAALAVEFQKQTLELMSIDSSQRSDEESRLAEYEKTLKKSDE